MRDPLKTYVVMPIKERAWRSEGAEQKVQ